MPANPWELRADVRPLEVAAMRWAEIASRMTRHGDEIADAARRATDGWDAAAADSYDEHRRQLLANLDRFTRLADQIADSLRAVGALVASSQKELDRSWANVALVPHEVVGESRHLVFRPEQDDDRGKVTRGQGETDEIRSRLALSLDQESTRLRAARAELVTVRTEVATLAGGTFIRGLATVTEESGVGTVPSASTSLPGSAQSGLAGLSALPPIAPLAVSMPDLTGLSPAGLAPFMAAAASGVAGRRRTGRRTDAAPPMGGMGGGAMGVRGGTMSRGMASGRSGPSRIASPQLEGQAGREAARGARGRAAVAQSEQEAEKEAKRAAIADKRADRAARRAERESRRRQQETAGALQPSDEDRCEGAERGVGVDPDAETGAEDEPPRR